MVISEQTRIAFIGGGKMGEAIMGGWIAAHETPAAALGPANFIVANPGEERRAYLQQRYQVACVADAREITEADLVVLAVKPQVMMGVVQQIAALPAYGADGQGPLFVSIAAGISTARIESALPDGARVVRVMPNTPLLVGAGATTVAGGAQTSLVDEALVCNLFACLGMASIVCEDEIDATSAVSGSGPAYVAALIEALRDAGVAQGLKGNLAEALAQQTVYGTAVLMRKTGQSALETRQAVCSPGGSTLAALAAMDEAGFARSVGFGVDAAIRRSKELGQC